jgi:hypothetical protein
MLPYHENLSEPFKHWVVEPDSFRQILSFAHFIHGFLTNFYIYEYNVMK